MLVICFLEHFSRSEISNAGGQFSLDAVTHI